MKLPITEIKSNPNNPRLIKDDAFKKLVTSIKEFPEMLEAREIVLNKEHIILGGNMRFRAAQEAGIKEIPVKIVDWSDDKQNEFIIKDNVSGGEWDWDILANEWDAEQLENWGLDTPESWQEESEVEEDEVPEVDESEPPKSKLGEIYQLGRHRVMCGDSTDKAKVELLMDGNKADMVFTDPPYGMDLDVGLSSASGVLDKNWKGWKGSKKNYSKVIGDDKDYDPQHIFDNFDCKEMFLWGADYYAERIPERNNGSWLVWNKTRNSEEQEQVGSHGSQFELCWSKQKHTREVINKLWRGLMGTETQDERKRIHPTQKPIEICSWFIDKFSKKDQNIIDLFLGSGSTLIACEQTDRICYGMELDPKYVDVIRKRWAKYCYTDTWEERWEELTPVLSEK